MIPAFLKQLFFMAEQRSWAYVARQTNIAYRKLLSLRSGTVDVIPAFRQSIRNAYQREAYSRLREVGFSSHQARRWSSYSTAEVRLKEQGLRLKIAELAIGATASHLHHSDLEVTSTYVDRYFGSMYEKIREGILDSPKSTEEIFDY